MQFLSGENSLKERKISDTVVRLLQGDITSCEVEAVVNVTGKLMVSTEDEEAPEPISIEPELWQDQDQDVIITPGEHVKAEYVLNAMSIETNARSGANKIRKTIRGILEEAQAQHLESIAVPAIGTGVGRFPAEKCAMILLEELTKSVQQEDNSLRKIVFVLDNQKTYKVFEQVLSNIKDS